jgi:N-acetylglucosaminyldiphosphoundecaprenol N-acetyl-beta-D-mannosaminyltransferase
MEQQALLDFNITRGKYASFIDYIISMSQRGISSTVCVANVHMFIEAYKDKEFLKIINDADIVTPDGKPLTWALQFLYGIKQDRVAGMDLLPNLLQVMSKQRMPVYFYGGASEMVEQTEQYLKTRFPDLLIAGLYSPPFRAFDESEEMKMTDHINDTKPSIVFVILGCPKQEKWMAAMKGKINAVMIGVGGALPVMIGTQKRAPKWMQRSGLEWFFRLYQEPRRLFKRYAVTNSLFIWIILKEFIKIKCLAPLKFSKEV